jgi:hypothetical protein
MERSNSGSCPIARFDLDFKAYLVTLYCVRFNITKIYILPTGLKCFVGISEQKEVISLQNIN